MRGELFAGRGVRYCSTSSGTKARVAGELGRDDAGMILMPQIFMRLPWLYKKLLGVDRGHKAEKFRLR